MGSLDLELGLPQPNGGLLNEDLREGHGAADFNENAGLQGPMEAVTGQDRRRGRGVWGALEVEVGGRGLLSQLLCHP